MAKTQLYEVVTGSDNMIYIIGGRNGNGDVPFVLQYNTATDTLLTHPRMLFGLVNFGGAAEDNGRIYTD